LPTLRKQQEEKDQQLFIRWSDANEPGAFGQIGSSDAATESGLVTLYEVCDILVLTGVVDDHAVNVWCLANAPTCSAINRKRLFAPIDDRFLLIDLIGSRIIEARTFRIGIKGELMIINLDQSLKKV